MEEAAESIEGLRTGAVALVSGRLGREGGGMVTGEAGGERPANDSVGDEACRSWACAAGRRVVVAIVGVVVDCAVGGCVDGAELCSSSSASSWSSFSRGDRGSS
jgi:hypothetical protein